MQIETIESIIDLIDISIKDEPESNIMGGNIIQYGYNKDVDYYRDIIDNSKEWLNNYRTELIGLTKITTLRIKYTSASGYFIEIPRSQIEKITTNFVHKQTLVNASRYITEELVKFESDLSNSEGKMSELEYNIFLDIREKILGESTIIRKISSKIAEVDVVGGLSKLAYLSNYTKPEINEKYKLEIVGGRHPVIETIEKDFISNNLSLNKQIFSHVITGPNMGGKSTFLRQNALIILMSHIGSFVPCSSAIIPLTDKIFSRVGANDNLYLGQSTFMVEMQEVANILNNATVNSFVIIDEVGRGTSTYDGMSIAWAILKENHDKIKAKTLFSTHYHELVDEANSLPGVANFSVAVGENSENIVFLRKVIPGSIKKSYGIEVAKLAGLSKNVLKEAKNMLFKLEANNTNQLVLGNFIVNNSEDNITENTESKIELELKNLDINSMTPIEALNILQKIKQNLEK